MAHYKKVTKKDVDIFLKLYQKYLDYQMENIKNALNKLPTDVIERCFYGKEFFKEGFDISKIDETEFGFGKLCGYQVIRDLANELDYYNSVLTEEELSSVLSKVGHKVNFKKIGVPND